MRITFSTVNRNVQRNLSRRYSDLVGLQEQLSTGKRLRKASDDPVDVANAIKLRAKEAQLGQYKRNIQDGLAVMGVGASAMGSMNELLHRARELAVQAANGTYNDSDRLYMQQEVDQLFRQMMSVVNTQFKGTYIFNGTNGNIPPYKIATSGADRMDYENRTMATFGTVFARKADGYDWDTHNIPDPGLVTASSHSMNNDTIYLNYATNSLRIGDKVQLAWRSGSTPPDARVNGRSLQYIYPETMPLDEMTINGRTFSNGVHRANIPAGTITTALTPEQLYTGAGGTIPVKNISTGSVEVTATDGGGNTFKLKEGQDYSINYATGTFTVLNPGYTAAPYSFDVKYRIDGEKGDYELDYVTGQISVLSDDFREALNNISNIDRPTLTAIDSTVYNPAPPLLNAPHGMTYRTDNVFQIVEGKLGDNIRDIFPGSMKIKIGDKEYTEGHGEYQPDYYDQEGVLQPGKNKFDYEVDYETGLITIYNLDLMRDMRPEWLGGPDRALDPDAPNNMYRQHQLQITFDYITRGVDIYGDRVTSAGDILRAIEEGIVAPINIKADDLLKDSRSGNDMVGSLLRYSQALLKDDREGIQRALDELTTMYDAVLNSQSQMGAKIFRFELTEQRNGEQTIEVGAQVSSLADADLAEVISRLMLAESVYNAALQSAMRVLQPSLANYM
ncbi:MAG: flagellar hook-associated protein FlgL [Chitinispirillales bacterium]|nr:flagellar hook-associated protein FlgL [Chitinispirillales bacterium]